MSMCRDRPDLHPILLEKIFRSPYWLMRDHGLMTRDEAIEAMIGATSRSARTSRA